MVKTSHVRLDPLHDRWDPFVDVYELRAYPQEIEIGKLFEDLTEQYELSGLVRISGTIAFVSMVTGYIRPAALKQFYRKLASMGVRTVTWERRKNQIKLVEKDL